MSAEEIHDDLDDEVERALRPRIVVDNKRIFAQRPWDTSKPLTRAEQDLANAFAQANGPPEDVDLMLQTVPPPRQWVVDGFLPRSKAMLLSARYGTGKSPLARSLAVGVALTGQFLGLPCQRGPVIWIDADDEGRDTFRRHLFQLAPGGIVRAGGQPMEYHDSNSYPGDPVRRVPWLRTRVASLGASLVIVDNIVQFLGIGESTVYAAVAQAVSPLMALREEHSVSFVWLHHTNNAGTIHGGNTWGRVPDICMLYKGRGTEPRYLRTEKTRGLIDEWPDTMVTYNRQTGFCEMGEKRWDSSVKEVEQAILTAGLTGTADSIARRCGFNNNLGREAVKRLIANGLLVGTKTGRSLIYAQPGATPLTLVAEGGSRGEDQTNLSEPFDYIIGQPKELSDTWAKMVEQVEPIERKELYEQTAMAPGSTARACSSPVSDSGRHLGGGAPGAPRGLEYADGSTGGGEGDRREVPELFVVQTDGATGVESDGDLAIHYCQQCGEETEAPGLCAGCFLGIEPK